MEIKSLTGLRGLAAVYVILLHCSSFMTGPVPQSLKHGYLSVDVFFMLSGFVMAASHNDLSIIKLKLTKYIDFMRRRVARVWPLLAFCILLVSTKEFMHGKIPTTTDFMTNILMIQEWVGTRDIVEPSWSISAEFFAYTIFPIITWMCLDLTVTGVSIIFVLMYIIIYIIGYTSLIPMEHVSGPLDVWGATARISILRCISEFVIGMITWRLYSHIKLGRPRHILPVADIVFPCIIVLLFIANSDIFICILIPVLIIDVSHRSSFSKKILSGPILYYLGKISYSLYLIHILFMTMLDRLRNALTLRHVIYPLFISGFFTIMAIVAASTVTYVFIEKPARRFLSGGTAFGRRSGSF